MAAIGIRSAKQPKEGSTTPIFQWSRVPCKSTTRQGLRVKRESRHLIPPTAHWPSAATTLTSRPSMPERVTTTPKMMKEADKRGSWRMKREAGENGDDCHLQSYGLNQ